MFIATGMYMSRRKSAGLPSQPTAELLPPDAQVPVEAPVPEAPAQPAEMSEAMQKWFATLPLANGPMRPPRE